MSVMNPYQVLGLDRSADEAAIRKRYLELVRLHPPDRDGERFAEIRDAYAQVRDPRARMESMILNYECTDSFQQVAVDLRARLGRSRLPIATLLALAEIKERHESP